MAMAPKMQSALDVSDRLNHSLVVPRDRSHPFTRLRLGRGAFAGDLTLDRFLAGSAC